LRAMMISADFVRWRRAFEADAGEAGIGGD
jgi:hypothetical protein